MKFYWYWRTGKEPGENAAGLNKILDQRRNEKAFCEEHNQYLQEFARVMNLQKKSYKTTV